MFESGAGPSAVELLQARGRANLLATLYGFGTMIRYREMVEHLKQRPRAFSHSRQPNRSWQSLAEHQDSVAGPDRGQYAPSRCLRQPHRQPARDIDAG